MNKYICIKPINLELEKRIEKFPPDFDYNIDYFYYLISNILQRTNHKFQNKKKDGVKVKEKDTWIPMCSKILKKEPYAYREHIRYLSKNLPNEGSILFRKDYGKGRCYAYKLSPFYSEKAVALQIITDKKILKFLKPEQNLKSNNKFKKTYCFLAKFFDNSRLKIDYENALSLNIEIYGKELDYKKHLNNAVQILNIANGEFNIYFNPETDGRIHSQITQLSKKLRKFLTFDNKKLVEIDISASVPTFLYFILSNLHSDNVHLSNIINNIHLSNISISNQSYYTHYMFCKSSVDLNNTDVSSFGEKVLSGTFYESFWDEMSTIHHFDETLKPDEYIYKNVKEICKRDFDGDMDDVRTVLKKNMLSMLNAVPAHYLNEEAVFNMKYESILRWVKKFKSKNHRFFSYLTLQTESYFMLHIIARNFNKKYRGKFPLFTLHDCIVTTEDNADLIFKFMEETFKNEIGFSPILKSKRWE